MTSLASDWSKTFSTTTLHMPIEIWTKLDRKHVVHVLKVIYQCFLGANPPTKVFSCTILGPSGLLFRATYILVCITGVLHREVVIDKNKLSLQIFGLMAIIEQIENNNNDNQCKFHGGL